MSKRCDQRLLRPAQKVFEKRHVLKKRTTWISKDVCG